MGTLKAPYISPKGETIMVDINTELTITSLGKTYSIDVYDWDVEKWKEWGRVTETWGTFEWFSFTRYLDSVNDDVWDALRHFRSVKYITSNELDFCNVGLTMLGEKPISSMATIVWISVDTKILKRLLKTSLKEKGFHVVEEEETGIFYLVNK